ncbi:MAG: polyprenyl synthetase family protein, partial [Rickettsiaceae bacterium]|nr:polyprenyl synthetase family protein [Rickettsiaceae bacterium]
NKDQNNPKDVISKLHQIYSEEILYMNQTIIEYIECEESMITDAAKHLINSGGKRIRPLMTILSAKLMGAGAQEVNYLKLAAATELIHTATLLHDDVVDSSLLRRFQPTVNAIWGNQEAILVGDFLFSVSFNLMVSANSLEALGTLALSSSIIAKGEVSQLSQKKSKGFITQEQYFKISSSKTAELFGSACKVGGIIVNAGHKCVDLLYEFGLNLGLIYQIKDDIMDYYSDSAIMGKNIGDDFYEGKITLPIILLRDALDPVNRVFLEKIFTEDEKARTKENLERVIFLLKKMDIATKLNLKIDELSKKALDCLDKIEDKESETKIYMRELVNFASNRVS